MRVLTKCLLFSCLACSACDESQALHDPHPSFERMQTDERIDPFGPQAMQSPPFATVPQESDDDEVADGGAIAFAVDARLLDDGRGDFDRFCAPCHGITGNGESVVATKMREAPPGSLVDGANATMPPAALYGVIRDGKRMMPSLAHELTRRERWAVVAYVGALVLSRHAPASVLSAQDREALDHGVVP